jgi:hypothetical protein
MDKDLNQQRGQNESAEQAPGSTSTATAESQEPLGAPEAPGKDPGADDDDDEG